MDVMKLNQKENMDLEFLCDLASKIRKEGQETHLSNKILATSCNLCLLRNALSFLC